MSGRPESLAAELPSEPLRIQLAEFGFLPEQQTRAYLWSWVSRFLSNHAELPAHVTTDEVAQLVVAVFDPERHSP